MWASHTTYHLLQVCRLLGLISAPQGWPTLTIFVWRHRGIQWCKHSFESLTTRTERSRLFIDIYFLLCLMYTYIHLLTLLWIFICFTWFHVTVIQYLRAAYNKRPQCLTSFVISASIWGSGLLMVLPSIVISIVVNISCYGRINCFNSNSRHRITGKQNLTNLTNQSDKSIWQISLTNLS